MRISLIVAFLALTSCTSKSRVVCDETVPCNTAGAETFCDIDGVYPASELKNECIEPPGPDACNRVEGCSSLAKPYCSDDSMGVCVECREGQDCGNGEICDANGACLVFSCEPGSGGDAACAGVDASQPYCGPGDTCVGCLDSGDCTVATAGVCDETDLQCRSCVTNPECDSKVCGIESGICADPANIVYVATTGTDGVNCGTLASPCLTIDGVNADGINGATAQLTATRNTILIAAGDYADPVVLTDEAVTIVGDGVVNIGTKTLGADTNAVLVSGDSIVAFSNVNITPDGGGSGSAALRCASAGGAPALTFANGTISGAGDVGVSASSCDLTVTGSTISGNAGGGILVDGSDYSIVNNFIVDNVASGIVSGFRAQNTATKSEELQFNTFARNQRGGATGFAVVCEVSNLVAANNILMLPEASIATLNVGCAHRFSLFDSADSLAPTGANDNVAGDAVFVDAAGGNYHLQSGSPGIDAADPAATLAIDIDGEARPKGAAMLRDMGADEAE